MSPSCPRLMGPTPLKRAFFVRRGRKPDRFRIPDWEDHFLGVMGRKPHFFVCPETFMQNSKFLDLDKVVRCTRT